MDFVASVFSLLRVLQWKLIILEDRNWHRSDERMQIFKYNSLESSTYINMIDSDSCGYLRYWSAIPFQSPILYFTDCNEEDGEDPVCAPHTRQLFSYPEPVVPFNHVVCGSLQVSYSSCQRKFHRNQLWKIVFSCLYSFYFAYQVVTWCPLSRLNPLNRYRLQRCFLFNTINSAKSQLGCLCHWISLAHPVVRIRGRLSLLPLRLRTTIKHGEKTKGCVKIIMKTLNYPFRLVIRVLNVCAQSWYA